MQGVVYYYLKADGDQLEMYTLNPKATTNKTKGYKLIN